ncbi:MAG: PAS domain S-box protein [Salinivirgaceae bacterium]|nr:PAS domain S-box protein [Salinivirgaceae bacterium]
MRIKRNPFYKYFVFIVIGWTLVFSVILAYDKFNNKASFKEITIAIADAYFTKDLAFREWATSHGGVYVEVDSLTPPNKYLNVDERDITTPKGRELTLMNPAYMTRQLNELLYDKYNLVGHITRINPIRKENAPDAWETDALNKFSLGENKVFEFFIDEPNPILRYMKPLHVSQACINCHNNLGYKIGDVGGGISLNLPLTEYLKKSKSEIKFGYISYFILWLIGMLGLVLAFKFFQKKYESEKKATLEIQQISERYKQLSNLTFEGILLHKEGVIIDANSALCKLLECKIEEIIGKNFIDLFLYDEHKDIFKRKTFLEHAYPFEIEIQLKSGIIIPVEIESLKTKIDDIVISTTAIRNVFSRNQAQAAIDKVQKKLNLHFELTPLAVIEWDLDFKIVRWNLSATRIFGYTFEEVIGRRSDFLIPGSKKEHVTNIWAHIKGMRNGEPTTNLNQTKEGKLITCNWYNTPLLNEYGNLIGVASMAQDITEQKKNIEKINAANYELMAAEEEIRGANEELTTTNQALHNNMIDLENAIIKAEESDRLKTAFLANMSHEIRTPLNGIIGFSQLLIDPDIASEKRQSFTDIIISSSNQLLSIVNDVLDISKIETGQVQLRLEPISIQTVFKELEVFFKPKTEKSDIEIYFENNLPEANDSIITDKGRLIQIFNNLINNAIKFTLKGQIRIQSNLIDNFILFSVNDTGIGIGDAFKTKIFERFHQVYNFLRDVPKGAGLGLTICKSLIELMKGEIWVESIIEVGSTFYFKIPFVQPEKIEEQMDINEENEKPLFSELKILIAEDVDYNYMLLTEYLEETQASFIRAKNGVEAVNFCLNDYDIDLVLMDIRMPIMDGYEATRKIKAIRPSIPVIAQTAFAFDEKQKAFDAGCDNIISKPIKKEILFDLINQYIHQEK